MATTKKKAPKPGDTGFLTTAAQTIGSKLGQLAVKAGVVTPPPAPAKPKKKAAAKKSVVAKKKAPAKKAAAPKKKAPAKKK